jgi:hypothetical protein
VGDEFRGPRLVEEALAEPFDLEKTITRTVAECFPQIEAGEYAAGFERFALALEEIESTSHNFLETREFQRSARHALEILWNAFIRDIRDRSKLSARLDKIISDAKTAREQAGERMKVSPNRLKYDAALREQKRKVVMFPNQNHRGLYDIETDTFQPRMQDPVLSEIRYVGTLYNHIYPLMRTLMEGYVKNSLIRAKSGATHYIPVCAQTIRDNVVSFLREAPDTAVRYAHIIDERNRTNDGWNSLYIRRSVRAKMDKRKKK